LVLVRSAFPRILQCLSKAHPDKTHLTYDPHLVSQRIKYGESLLSNAQKQYERQLDEEHQRELRLEKLRAYRQAEMERLQKEEVN
jgi:hypothetical protein